MEMLGIGSSHVHGPKFQEAYLSRLVREAKSASLRHAADDGSGDDEDLHEYDRGLGFREFARAVRESVRPGSEPNEFGNVFTALEAKLASEPGRTVTYLFLLFTFLVLVGASTAVFGFFQCQTFDEVCYFL